MRTATYDRFCHLIYDSCGITLGASKQTLVSARLGKRLRALGLDSPEDYLSVLEHDEAERVQLLDAISTNVTSFYREADHFEFLADWAARRRAEGARKLRIWCAAASTGEEPYTIAMALRRALPEGFDARLLATDISTRALEAAIRGEYDEERVAPVPVDEKRRWFTTSGRRPQRTFAVSDELKQMILFRRLNLAKPPFPMRGPLDLVICRNVMIYFDRAVRQRLVEAVWNLLPPGGYFLVGHSESLKGVTEDFEVIRPSIYRRPQ